MNNFKKGFTLIEIMVVVSLIGILVAIVLVNLNDARNESREAKAREELKNIEIAFTMYRQETGVMPPSADNCSLCGWGGWGNAVSVSVQDDWLDAIAPTAAVVSARLPERDPWGRYYAYDNNFIVSGAGYPSIVCSVGVDGVLQTWLSFPVPLNIRKVSQGDDICIFMSEPDDVP